MILELKLQNYLSFKDEVVLSFEATTDKTLEEYYVAKQPDGTRLLKMAMVFGANASGKSNLIQAFEFLKDFVHNIPEERDAGTEFVPFMFDKTKNEPGRFELTFYLKGKKHKFLLAIDNETVFEEKLLYYPGVQPATIFSRKYDHKKNISDIEFGPKIKISNQACEAIQLKTLKNASVIAAYNQVNISIPEIDIVNDWFKEQYLNSINPYHLLTNFSNKEIKTNTKIKELALSFLKEADFNISDIEIEDKTYNIPENILKSIDISQFTEEEKAKIRKEKVIHYDEAIFKHKIIKENKIEYHSLPEDRQSKGTIRYYGLSAPFFHTIANDGFLPIDEIGSALHPLLIMHFLRHFLQKSKQAQLLFTTHNLSLLNEKDILRKDAVWFTEKKENGSTSLYSLADFNFRKELSFYNAYKIGKFGAIPDLD